MKIVKDLNTKSVTGLTIDELREIAKKGKGKAVPLYSIFGRVTSHKIVSGKDDSKTSVKLGGQFRGVYKKEKCQGPNCYIPCDFANLVVTQLASVDKSVQHPSVDFAVNVSIKHDASSAVGYVFEVASPMEPSEEDFLSKMETSLSSKLLTA